MKETLECKFCDWKTFKVIETEDDYRDVECAHQRLIEHVQRSHFVQYMKIQRKLFLHYKDIQCKILNEDDNHTVMRKEYT